VPLVRLDGCDLHYTLIGPPEAPVVLLLHGLGSSGDDWALQATALAERYRVVTVDLPGHHRSPRPHGWMSIGGMAAEVTRLLGALSLDRVHVVGLSLGGCVALALAIRRPAQVQSLVLVNTFAQLRPGGPRAALRGAGRLLLALAAPMPVLARYVAREAFPGADQAPLRQAAAARLAQNSRRSYLGCLAAVLAFDVRRQLGDIGCPTLVVAGDRDRTVPHAAKVLLARSISGARLAVVEDSGHVTQYDQPVVFNALLLEHMDRVASMLAR
jgi:3-oxoadipate enol-lactonase